MLPKARRFFSTKTQAALKDHACGKEKKAAILTAPALTSEQKLNIKSIVAIDFQPIGVSWCKLEGKQVTEWDSEVIDTKVLKDHMAILNKAREIADLIPSADTYVEEGKLLISKATNPMYLGTYSRSLQLHSSLLTLISSQNPEPLYIMMKPFAVQKLYKLRVGNERSSTQKVVQHFIAPHDDTTDRPPLLIDLFPGFADEFILANYLKRRHEVKETMSTALLVGLTFMSEVLAKNGDDRKSEERDQS